MSKVKFHGWDKKPKTMLRYLKPGDIFAFGLDDGTYGFGRLMTKVDIGFVAEIFAYASDTPTIPEAEVLKGERAFGPFCLDAYSLFDRKLKGEWRIIGHQQDYEPSNYEGVYFVYGASGMQKRVDIFDNETRVSDAEAAQWPYYSPRGHLDVLRELDAIGFPENLVVKA